MGGKAAPLAVAAGAQGRSRPAPHLAATDRPPVRPRTEPEPAGARLSKPVVLHFGPGGALPGSRRAEPAAPRGRERDGPGRGDPIRLNCHTRLPPLPSLPVHGSPAGRLPGSGSGSAPPRSPRRALLFSSLLSSPPPQRRRRPAIVTGREPAARRGRRRQRRAARNGGRGERDLDWAGQSRGGGSGGAGSGASPPPSARGPRYLLAARAAQTHRPSMGQRR